MCIVAARSDAGAEKPAGQASQGLEKYTASKYTALGSRTWCLHDQAACCQVFVPFAGITSGKIQRRLVLYSCCTVCILLLLFHYNIPGQTICIRNICRNVIGSPRISFFLGGGGEGADPEAICNLCLTSKTIL